MRCLCFLAAFIVLSSRPPLLPAQEAINDQPSAQFTIHARTVIEDVVVLDKAGHAVPNLRRQDFQILENGKPQAVTFFEPNFAAPDSPVSPSNLPANTFTNTPLANTQNVTNVLLLDALNSWPEDEMFAHVQMVEYLAALPPHMRIAVFTLDPERLNLIWPLNQDSSVLSEAVATFNSRHSRQSSMAARRSALVDHLTQAANQSSDERMIESATALQHFLKSGVGIIQSHNQALSTMNALQALARYLAAIPGRKNLFWIIGNFPICSSCGYDVFGQTMDLLAQAQVAVYPIDAGGINSDMGVGPSAADHQVATRFIDSEIWARNTGGKAFHNNDLRGEIEDAAEHGSRYYTVAYVPTDTNEDGRERKVEIKIGSGNYTLSYRRRYVEQTPKEIARANAKPASTPLIPRMGHGLPNASDLPYRLKVVPSALQPASAASLANSKTKLTGKLTRYNVDFELQPGSLSLQPEPDGSRRRDLQVALVVYSADFKPLNWDIRTVHLHITPDQWTAAQIAAIPIHLQMDAPSGDVSLRTGIYDPASGKAGTLEIPLKIITIGQK